MHKGHDLDLKGTPKCYINAVYTPWHELTTVWIARVCWKQDLHCKLWDPSYMDKPCVTTP